VTVRLRPHHLLCILTYAGRGYSPAFGANMDMVVARIATGEEIEIVAGADDICTPMLCEDTPHCHNDSVRARDALAAEAISKLVGRAIVAGGKFSLATGTCAILRTAFTAGPLRKACEGCEWQELCTEISATKYRQATLQIE
jgi:uncharacterized protein